MQLPEHLNSCWFVLLKNPVYHIYIQTAAMHGQLTRVVGVRVSKKKARSNITLNNMFFLITKWS